MVTDDVAVKRETLAEIARTVAHDFGNMIAAMGMSVSLARLKMDKGQDGAKLALDDAELACERATKLAKLLAALARGEVEMPHVLSLHDLITIMASVCAKSATAPIELQVDPHLHRVEGDEVQLALVLYAVIMTAVRGSSEEQRVALVADNHDSCVRISVDYKSHGEPPLFSMDHAAPIVKCHRGRIVHQPGAGHMTLSVLLPAVV